MLTGSRTYDESYMETYIETCKEFTSGFKSCKPKLYKPSLSAHLESSFDEFGAYGYIMKRVKCGITYPLKEAVEIPILNVETGEIITELLEVQSTLRPKDELTGEEIGPDGNVEDLSSALNMIGRSEFYSMEYIPQLNTTIEYRSVDVLYRNDIGKLRSMILEDYGFFNTPLPEDFRSTMVYPTSHMLTVKTYGISEPLKVRMITKGQVLPYYFSKFFQKATWKFLSKFKQFALTHETLNDNHILEILDQEAYIEKYFNGKLGFNSWVSGDYSAATDNIKSKYTVAAFECFLDKSDLTEVDKNILRGVIYSSKITYPKSTGIDELIQQNGQLMGSPLSFPILCAINLISYAIAFRKYMKELGCLHEVPLNRLPVKVNGDDILFRSNKRFYVIWQESIKEVGFSLSIGKNYIHTDILTINSTCYLFKGNKLEKIDYINVGLLTGQSKLRVRSGKELLPLSDWYNKVLAGTDHQLITHKYFLFYHKDRINILTEGGKYNLFAPILLGGLGFINHGIENFFTDFQLKLAFFLRERYDLFQGTQSQLKKLAFRPLISSTLLSSPAVEDNSQYSAFLLPGDFSNDIYEQVLHKREMHTPFTWSSGAFFQRTNQESVEDALELSMKVRPVKDRFWKRFNNAYESIRPMDASLMCLTWKLYDVPSEFTYIVREKPISKKINTRTILESKVALIFKEKDYTETYKFIKEPVKGL